MHHTVPNLLFRLGFKKKKIACIGHGLDPEGKKLSRAKDSLPEFFRAEPSKRLNILIFSSRVEPKAQYLDMLEPS
jgi:hypothetical protein